MANEFDLNALFRYGFGTARGIAINADPELRKPYDKNQIKEFVIKEETPFDDQPSIDTSEDEFGTMRDILGSNLPDGRKVFMPCKIGDLLLPNEPTISIEGGKIIKKTSLTGYKGKGQVKELIRLADAKLTIRGIAINYTSNKVYPEKIVKDLYELVQLNEALEIKCALTSLLSIYKVVIEKYHFPEMIGVQHAQAYEFQCTSDEEFILEI